MAGLGLSSQASIDNQLLQASILSSRRTSGLGVESSTPFNLLQRLRDPYMASQGSAVASAVDIQRALSGQGQEVNAAKSSPTEVINEILRRAGRESSLGPRSDQQGGFSY